MVEKNFFEGLSDLKDKPLPDLNKPVKVKQVTKEEPLSNEPLPTAPDMEQFKATYQAKLKQAKEYREQALKAYEQADTEYSKVQYYYAEKYKSFIAKRFLKAWNSPTGKFPKDDELTDAIFFLAGLEVERAPDITLHYDSLTCTFRLTYYNRRLKKHQELKP